MSTQEIERKFYVQESQLRDLGLLSGEIQFEERYYLRKDKEVEERITKKSKGNSIKYQYDYLEEQSSDISSRKKESRELTTEEFEEMKERAISEMTLERESYKLKQYPNTSVKIYRGKFLGLVRVEFEFESEEAGESFTFPEWIDMSKEITHLQIGRDGKLLRMSIEEFLRELETIENKGTR